MNKIDDVIYLVKQDRKLLFDHDYFGQTGYHWAAKRNYIELLKELINCGKHHNLLDHDSRTPLFLAAYNNHYEAVKILIDNKATNQLKNIQGLSPSDVSTDHKIKMLIEDEKKDQKLNDRSFIQTVINYYKKEIQQIQEKKKYKKIAIDDYSTTPNSDIVPHDNKYDVNFVNKVKSIS